MIVLILLVLILIGGLLLLVKYIPLIVAKYRAKSFGLNLTINESAIILKYNCFQKEFFLGALEILKIERVPFESLASHFASGGNLENLIVGIAELQKRQKQIDFQILSAVDLAGKNIKKEIINADEQYLIEISSIENKSIEIIYKAQFKYNFPESVWIEKNTENLSLKIHDKLKVFIKSWEESDIVKTESFILDNILPTSFWENELRGILIKQEIDILKKT